MMETLKAMSVFFQQNNMLKTLAAFKYQIQIVLKEPRNSLHKTDLLSIISKCLNQQTLRNMPKKTRKQQTKNKKPLVLYTQDQAQNIMQKFMNKMINSKKVNQNDRLKNQIAKLSNTKVFQKLVQNTDVFQDMSNISFSQKKQKSSFIQSNKDVTQKSEQIKYVKDSISNQKRFPQQIHDLKRSPSIGDLQIFPKQNSQSINSKNNMSNQVLKKQGISFIQSQNQVNDSSIISNPSLVLEGLEQAENIIDTYQSNDDPGYQIYQVNQKEFRNIGKRLAQKYNYPKSAFIPNSQSKPKTDQMEKKHLPEHCLFPHSNDDFYPTQFQQVIYDCFNLKVIYNRQKTGFQQSKDFPIVINDIIGGRYQVIQFLGSAAFSKAIHVQDLISEKRYCMKIIQNNKDYFDQSIDQIKLLKYINYNGDVDQHRVLKMYDYFYYKEHLFIVTQLLGDNLYQLYNNLRNKNQPNYFTLGRLQQISREILKALKYIHSLELIHSDLKPENILMESIQKTSIKVIDFGSSIYTHDRLSSYIQTRSYRAPEVILGCRYDAKIDIWSFGAIIAQLFTGIQKQSGNVLFQNDSIQGFLARVFSIVGPWPQWMIQKGKLINNFMSKQKIIFQQGYQGEQASHNNVYENSDMMDKRRKTGSIFYLIPKKTCLQARLNTKDPYFVDFIKWSLTIDPIKRPTAQQLLEHPFLTQVKYDQ